MRDAMILSLGLAGLALLSPTPAPADGTPRCTPRPQALALLGETLRQSRQSIGLSGTGLVVELYADPEARRWTILATRPDGLSCILAAGGAYEATEDAIPPGGAPA